jgi:aryl-alcohol dehydrogenase-like predicted oxidoreductase/histidinol phosphatase-like enzyme
MRLSTSPDRDDDRAIAVLHAAFDGGVTFLDTADAYCRDDADVGHNERLIARALATWKGDRSRIVVATKGGLTRPGGEWVPDGRARHLRAACEASLRALGVERVQLYQLHAVDSRTPLSTSVRALAALKDERLVERIGLCNVTVGQIEEARRITEISSVQVALSPWHDTSVLNGVVEYCIAHVLQLIAYRPLGGSRLLRRMISDPVLAEVAARHEASATEIALAWLEGLAEAIVAIPGPTRLETVRSVIRAHSIRLTEEDRLRLDAQFPAGQAIRRASETAATGEPAPVPAQARTNGEVVLIMGLPGAGKSTVARQFVAQGYARLNRDETGGSLRALLPRLERLIATGSSQIVLDNTYVSRASRALVVQAATRLGLPVRCVWLSTNVEAAQVNAAWRMVSKYGRLLGPDEMRKTVERDISAFPPGVQFRHQRELEPPDPSEGFAVIETMSFERVRDPSMTNKAVIVWCDGVLVRRSADDDGRTPVSPEDVDVFDGRGVVLRRYHEEGWKLLGLSWQPEIADKAMTSEQADARLARVRELLGVPIEILYCPHGAGPPICWCRKPLPGLGIVFIQRHRLDPSQCIYVGAGPQDPGFARRLGFQYRDAEDFFAGGM